MPPSPRLLRITTVPISLKLLLHGQLTFMQQHGFEVLSVSADGREVADLQSLGIPHEVVPMTRKITPLRDAYALWKLVRLIQKVKPDIVHTHTPKAGLLGMIAARICGVPVRMHTVAGLPLMEAKGLKRKVLVITEKITCLCATRVYPNSLGLLNYMSSQLSIVNCQLSIIGKGSSNGIDAQHFSRSTGLMQEARDIRIRYHLPDEAIAFGFVGRLVKDKGIVELINAFIRVSKELQAYLILVGPFEQELDPLPKEVMQFIEQSPQVIKAGFQDDVRPWLLASEVFVFPSYREGFPNVVMQAACLEVPAIVSDINGCNELIQDKESGLLVPAKNETALYEAMKTLATHPELRSSYATKARAFVSTHFNQHVIWQELLKEYHTLMASASSH